MYRQVMLYRRHLPVCWSCTGSLTADKRAGTMAVPCTAISAVDCVVELLRRQLGADALRKLHQLGPVERA